MSVQAYVLIEIDGAKAKSAYEKISKLAGVKSVSAVTGPYDIIAQVEGNGLLDIGEVVASKIRAVDGVAKTITCVGVKL